MNGNPTGIPEEPHDARHNTRDKEELNPASPMPGEPAALNLDAADLESAERDAANLDTADQDAAERDVAERNTFIEPARQAAHHDGLYIVQPSGGSHSEIHPEGEPPWPPEPHFDHGFHPPDPPARIPNFGHFSLLLLLLGFGLLCTGILTRAALRAHLFGIANVQAAITDIHYTLGSEAILYLTTLAACLAVFPFVWHKNFFAGVQWNGATALRLRWRLVSAAGICFLLALLNSAVMPGPANAPIDKIFRAPGAAWLLFAFGVTFAPFFEETFFRGFLLPALCTAYDWFGERSGHGFRRPLAEDGHPRWSMSAMVFGSILTSIPFALLHAQQTGYAVGALLLLVGVSLVLCAVRLSTRSLAASVLVHASYNFMLFFIMLVGTGGFRHLEKM